MIDDFVTKVLSSFVIYPDWLCETHIREIDDLITSGEKSAAIEYAEDMRANDWSCETCQELKAAK